MPTVVNIKVEHLRKRGFTSLENWKQDKGHLYIGCANGWVAGATKSDWHNPFAVKKYGLEECLRFYEEHIRKSDLYNRLEELAECTELGCYCKPGPCHGDILLKLLEERRGNSETKMEHYKNAILGDDGEVDLLRQKSINSILESLTKIDTGSLVSEAEYYVKKLRVPASFTVVHDNGTTVTVEKSSPTSVRINGTKVTLIGDEEDLTEEQQEIYEEYNEEDGKDYALRKATFNGIDYGGEFDLVVVEFIENLVFRLLDGKEVPEKITIDNKNRVKTNGKKYSLPETRTGLMSIVWDEFIAKL